MLTDYTSQRVWKTRGAATKALLKGLVDNFRVPSNSKKGLAGTEGHCTSHVGGVAGGAPNPYKPKETSEMLKHTDMGLQIPVCMLNTQAKIA